MGACGRSSRGMPETGPGRLAGPAWPGSGPCGSASGCDCSRLSGTGAAAKPFLAAGAACVLSSRGVRPRTGSPEPESRREAPPDAGVRTGRASVPRSWAARRDRAGRAAAAGYGVSGYGVSGYAVAGYGVSGYAVAGYGVSGCCAAGRSGRCTAGYWAVGCCAADGCGDGWVTGRDAGDRGAGDGDAADGDAGDGDAGDGDAAEGDGADGDRADGAAGWAMVVSGLSAASSAQ